MNISEILEGKVNKSSVEEQKEILDQMKEKAIFDLEETERKNLIDFICEADTELAIDYLFHVLDEEVSYPIDDEKVKSLFSDERMGKLKNAMMEQLQNDEDETELVDEETSDEEASDED